MDLLGRITHIDASDMCARLPKVVLTLTSGDHYEQIECLGVHAQLVFGKIKTLHARA